MSKGEENLPQTVAAREAIEEVAAMHLSPCHHPRIITYI
jgi:hypothetical protein